LYHSHVLFIFYIYSTCHSSDEVGQSTVWKKLVCLVQQFLFGLIITKLGCMGISMQCKGELWWPCTCRTELLMIYLCKNDCFGTEIENLVEKHGGESVNY